MTAPLQQMILAFDASCGTCRTVSAAVSEACDGRLATMGLADERVIAWRHRALGEETPFEPTLIRLLTDGRVDAWVGSRMLKPLLTHLGAKDAWRVTRALGDLKQQTKDLSSSRMHPRGVSRLAFLQVGAGVVAGVSIMNGGSAFAASVGAPHAKRITKQTFAATSASLPKLMSLPDVSNLLSSSSRQEILKAIPQQSKASEATLVLSATSGRTLSSVDPATGRATYKTGRHSVISQNKHELPGGITMTATAITLDMDRALSIEEYSSPYNGVTSQALLYQVDYEGGGKLNLLDASVNGQLDRIVDSSASTAVSSSTNTTAADPCGKCKISGGGYVLAARCRASDNVTCALNVVGCVGCASTCAVINPACIACVIAACGFAIKNCCNKRTKACRFCGYA